MYYVKIRANDLKKEQLLMTASNQSSLDLGWNFNVLSNIMNQSITAQFTGFV